MQIIKLLMVLFLFGVLCACSEEKEKGENEEEEAFPIAVFENIRRIYSEDGILKIKVEAPLERVYSNENVIYPENFRISMYEPNGTITTTLTADSGKFERITKLYHAYGNVEVINHEKEQKVNSPELHWNQLKREIFTDTEIAIKTPTEILFGVGMTSNEDFSKYKIKKPTGSFVYQERSEGFDVPDSTDMQRQKPSSTSPSLQRNRNLQRAKNE